MPINNNYQDLLDSGVPMADVKRFRYQQRADLAAGGVPVSEIDKYQGPDIRSDKTYTNAVLRTMLESPENVALAIRKDDREMYNMIVSEALPSQKQMIKEKFAVALYMSKVSDTPFDVVFEQFNVAVNDFFGEQLKPGAAYKRLGELYSPKQGDASAQVSSEAFEGWKFAIEVAGAEVAEQEAMRKQVERFGGIAPVEPLQFEVNRQVGRRLAQREREVAPADAIPVVGAIISAWEESTDAPNEAIETLNAMTKTVALSKLKNLYGADTINAEEKLEIQKELLQIQRKARMQVQSAQLEGMSEVNRYAYQLSEQASIMAGWLAVGGFVGGGATLAAQMGGAGLQAAGEAYLGLLDAGVKDEAAIPIAAISGTIQGAIEGIMDAFTGKGLIKSTPGMKNLISKFLPELAEEGLQAFTGKTWEEIGKNLNNAVYGTDIAAKGLSDMGEIVAESAMEMIQAAPLVFGLTGVMGVAGGVANRAQTHYQKRQLNEAKRVIYEKRLAELQEKAKKAGQPVVEVAPPADVVAEAPAEAEAEADVQADADADWVGTGQVSQELAAMPARVGKSSSRQVVNENIEVLKAELKKEGIAFDEQYSGETRENVLSRYMRKKGGRGIDQWLIRANELGLAELDAEPWDAISGILQAKNVAKVNAEEGIKLYKSRDLDVGEIAESGTDTGPEIIVEKDAEGNITTIDANGRVHEYPADYTIQGGDPKTATIDELIEAQTAYGRARPEDGDTSFDFGDEAEPAPEAQAVATPETLTQNQMEKMAAGEKDEKGQRGTRWLDRLQKFEGKKGSWQLALDEFASEKGYTRQGDRYVLTEAEPAAEQSAGDAEYLAAVDAGDTETAQKMVDDAAKAAGYNVGPVYHGTAYLGNDLREGYFTTRQSEAQVVAQRKGGSRVVPVYLKIESPYQFERTGKDSKIMPDEISDMQYDGVITDDGHFYVFNSSQIKSADPITRDDQGNVIPLSKRFAPGEDIRGDVSAVKPAAEPAKPAAKVEPPLTAAEQVELEVLTEAQAEPEVVEELLEQRDADENIEIIAAIMRNEYVRNGIPLPDGKKWVDGDQFKHVRLRASRILNGLKEVPMEERMTAKRALMHVLETGMQNDALGIAQQIIDNKNRMATPHETLAMEVRLEELEDRLADARAEQMQFGDNPAAAAAAKAEIETLINELNKITEAGLRTGTRAGQALAARRWRTNMRGNRAWATIVAEATQVKGTPLTSAEFLDLQAKHAELVGVYEAVQKQMGELQSALDAKTAELAALSLEEDAATVPLKRKKSQILRSRMAIKKEIKKLLGGGLFDVSSTVPLSYEMTDLLSRLARTYVEEGITDMKLLSDRMMSDVPDLTQKDIFEVLANRRRGALKRAQSDMAMRMKELKKQAKTELELMALADKAGIPHDQIKSNMALLEKLKEHSVKTEVNENTLERLLAKINDAEARLGHLRASYKKDPKASLDAQVSAAREALREVTAVLNAKEKLAMLQERIDNQDFSEYRPERRAAIESERLDALKYKIRPKEKQLRDAIESLRPLTGSEKLFANIADINQAMRMLQASGEASFTLRQMLFPLTYLGFSGKAGIQKGSAAFTQAAKTAFSQERFDLLMTGIYDDPRFVMWSKAGLKISDPDGPITQRDERFGYRVGEVISKTIGKAPWVRASERHAVALGNLARIAAFETGVQANPQWTAEQRQAWAKLVNAMSGASNVKALVSPEGMKWLGLLFYAPNFAMSRIEAPLRAGTMLFNKGMRKEAVKSLAGMIAPQVVLYNLAKLMGLTVGDDPEEFDYLRIWVGNAALDLMAGANQPLRALITSVLYVLDAKGWREMTNKKSGTEAWIRFMKNKMSPLTSYSSSMAMGTDFFGRPKHRGWMTVEQVMPMFISEIADAVWSNRHDKEQMLKVTSAVLPAVFFGAGSAVMTNPLMTGEVMRIYKAAGLASIPGLSFPQEMKRDREMIEAMDKATVSFQWKAATWLLSNTDKLKKDIQTKMTELRNDEMNKLPKGVK